MMSETSKKAKKKQNKLRVKDFIKLLQLLEKLYQKPLGTNSELFNFIKELEDILKPYKELEKDEFLEMLETSLPSYKEAKTKKEKKALQNIDVENISLNDLRTLLSDKDLTKEELLYIGERRFGISRGAHMRLKKDELQELIERAIDDVEKFGIIKSKASE